MDLPSSFATDVRSYWIRVDAGEIQFGIGSVAGLHSIFSWVRGWYKEGHGCVWYILECGCGWYVMYQNLRVADVEEESVRGWVPAELPL